MKRRLRIILAFILVICLTACAGTEKRWQEQYELGLRYLSDGQYEPAILAFNAAIEIDEKRSEGYFSRGQAYYGLSSAVEENADIELFQGLETLEEKMLFCYEQAIRDYEKAIELAPETAEYYDEIMRITLEHGDIDLMLHYGEQKYQNVDDGNMREVFENAQKGLALMDQLAKAFQGGSDENIFALMQGESYESLLYLQEYLERPILREYGDKSLGVYRVDDDKYGHCMIYYGDYVDGIRNGSGAWYGYYDGNNYASHGDWAEDMPNGYFETKEWNSNLAETVVYRLVSGDVSSGLWNGDVVWAFEEEDAYSSWDCSFVNGIGVIVDEWVDPEDGTTHYSWSTQSREGKSGLSAKEGTENNPRGIAGFLFDEIPSDSGD